MKNFVENLSNLVKVKTIVTLAVITVFVILALRGDIPVDNVMVIVSTVVAFYFGTQHEKKVPNSDTAKANDEPTGTFALDASYIRTGTIDPAAAEIHQTGLLCSEEEERDTVVAGFAG